MTKKHCSLSRRQLLGSVAALPLLPLSGVSSAKPSGQSISKPIPSSGEALPVVGMGTWISFNVGSDTQALAQRQQVLEAFFGAGGGMIDSSPMYGSAEAVLGRLLPRVPSTSGLFSATKVWTRAGDDGPAEMEQSRQLWGLPRFDLLQIHNLLGWQAHIETLKAMKADGRVRYIGVTTSHGRRHRELESIMADEPIDFVQLTYNLADREAEQRLFPIATERGIAVIANRPFQGGTLIDRAKRQPLPSWAAEADCRDWPQLLLKFIVSHPAITCAIPATSQVAHMRQNMGAGQGRLPDPELRRRMAGLIGQL